MNEPESYIDRIQRLATHNKDLKAQLSEMMKRFANVENQNQYFQEALLRYAPQIKNSIYTLCLG
jgi:adenylate cyclase